MAGRLLIASNRLPYTFEPQENFSYELKQSTGGLVSGLKSLHESGNALWIGSANVNELSAEQISIMEEELHARHCIPLYLDQEESLGFYDGFSNSTIWPLFHQFSQFSEFSRSSWDDYVSVNRKFADLVLSTMDDEDVVWVHDYQLMLVPEMIRNKKPDATIGFFLHIPFPTFEIFRMLPWRKEILQGILGAALIGFHTYDYAQYFLTSCRHIVGLENRYGKMFFDDRVVQADAFPLGVDYEFFRSTAQNPSVQEKARAYKDLKVPDSKIVLSIERLDYTKGIAEGLTALDSFLEKNSDLIGQVVFTLLVVPSRENVDSYQDLKSQVDEAVGAINGKYSTVSWSPIDYYYRSVDVEELCSFYVASDVMMVTPLRDGMNLVCKEYLATHDQGPGVLILSEMAGSVYELSDALIINPFSPEEYVAAIKEALTMPEEEQKRRNRTMQSRLRSYTSKKWAADFLESLHKIKEEQNDLKTRKLSDSTMSLLRTDYHNTEKRILFLDYDGTLVSFKENPSEARPNKELMTILSNLCSNQKNDVVIISGRDYQTLDSWFGELPIHMVAEHGMWLYDHTQRLWTLSAPQNAEWKKSIEAVLESFVNRTPGSFIEEKDFSLVWHCRACGDELAERRMNEVVTRLWEEAESKGLTLLEGNRVIEIKPQNVNKGIAAHTWLRKNDYDFFLAAGDDTTDEDLFDVMPENAWTIKLGLDSTRARFYLTDNKDLQGLLTSLSV